MLAAAAATALIPLCLFTVDTAEYAVVTQFGEPVQVLREPGLGVKLPTRASTSLTIACSSMRRR
jgi:modulator of FtsH protease HflC